MAFDFGLILFLIILNGVFVISKMALSPPARRASSNWPKTVAPAPLGLWTWRNPTAHPCPLSVGRTDRPHLSGPALIRPECGVI
jgi:hypothetical protein